MKKSLNIVIVGTGMYACGKGTDGYGIIAPAIYEWAKNNIIGELYVAGTRPEGVRIAKRKMMELCRFVGVKINVGYFPEGKVRDEQSYKKAFAAIARPACAIVAVPDIAHADITKAAIAEGLHSLVVKPLAPTMKEVLTLVKLGREKKVYCAVEFHKRLDEANLMLKNVVSSGRIGDPLYFLVEYSQRKSIPSQRFKKWVGTTNIFQYLGIHYVDIIYFTTGAVPVRAMAMGKKGWLLSQGIDTYDSVCGVIEWKMSGGKRFTSHILTNWIDPESTSAMSDQKIKVIGTKGRFESDQKQRGITIVTDDKGVEEPNPYFCCAYGPAGETEYRGYGIDSIHRFLDDVVDIETGKVRLKDLEAKRPTFRQSLVPTVVLEAVNKSLKRKGEWVRIKDI